MAVYKIQHRTDTTNNWNTHNPVLLKGEIGIEFQGAGLVAWKVGDGVNSWTALPYTSGPAGAPGKDGKPGTNGTNGTSGFRGPRSNYTDYNGASGLTAPSDGWIHIRALASGGTLHIGVINQTADVEAHGYAPKANTTASLTMPVRAGDRISQTMWDGEFTNPICRFHSGN